MPRAAEASGRLSVQETSRPPSSSFAIGDRELDLNDGVPRQLGHADRGAGMAPLIAEHLDEEIGSGVENLRLIVEARSRGDVAADLEHLVDAIERADGGLEAREPLHDADPGLAPCRLEIHVAAGL